MTMSPRRSASGSASSSAVRNWLDTSPRTGIGAGAQRQPPFRSPTAQRRVAGPAQSLDAQPSGTQRLHGSPIGRSCMRGTPTASNGRPDVAASRASAAASGRIAVPALPRKVGLVRRRQPAARPTAHRQAAIRPQPAAERRSASSMTRVSSESSRSLTRWCLASAASSSTGWRCSWSPAPHSCRRQAARWGRQVDGDVERMMASAIIGVAGRLPRGICDRPWSSRALGRCGSGSSSASALPSAQHVFEGVERWRKRHRLLQQLFAVGQKMCRARSPGSLAAMRGKSRKPGPASDRKSRPAGWRDHRIEVGEGQQVRQVADRGEGGRGSRRHLAAPGRRWRSRHRWPSHQLARSAAAASG